MATDPRAPRLAKTVQPDEIREKTGIGPCLVPAMSRARAGIRHRFVAATVSLVYRDCLPCVLGSDFSVWVQV